MLFSSKGGASVDPKHLLLAQFRSQIESKEMEEYVYSLKAVLLGLATSFRQNYRNPDLVEALAAHVDSCLVLWSSGKLFSPYFVVCQSSGYGKSRLLRELAYHNQEVYKVLYICLRGKRSTGYPVANRVALELLKSFQSKTYSAVAMCLGKWLVAMLTYLSQSDQLITFEHVEIMDEDATSLFQSFTLGSEGRSDESVEGKELEGFKPPSSKSRLILAFDEAGFLLNHFVEGEDGKSVSLFRVLRRVLRQLDLSAPVVAIFCDTNSRVGEFAPPAIRDSSMRYDPKDPEAHIHIYPSFVEVATTDCLPPPPSLDFPTRAFLRGRPLWSSMLPSCKTSTSLVLFAKKKLFGGIIPTPLSEVDWVVLFAVCCNLRFSASTWMTADVVAHHMATLLAIHCSREAMVICYPSEPVLAEAALNCMGENIQSTLSEGLSVVNDFLMQDMVLEGYCGEFCACFLLLLGRLRMKEGEFYSTPISLINFLCGIFDQDKVKEQIKAVLCTSWENAQISFTHFIQYHVNEQLFYRDPQELLEWLYERCQAVVMPPGWTGADILIPICVNSSSPSLYPSASQKFYSYALIQVKNIVNMTKRELEEARDKLLPGVVFGNCSAHFHWFSNHNLRHCLLMILNVGAAKGRIMIKEIDTTKQSFFWVEAEGIQASKLNLSDEVVARLRRLTRPFDFSDHVDSKDSKAKLFRMKSGCMPKI